jgi:hypothetical protein
MTELRFVIGHEMGHAMNTSAKIQLAYAASAVRKGIASQQNTAGDVARSLFEVWQNPHERTVFSWKKIRRLCGILKKEKLELMASFQL